MSRRRLSVADQLLDEARSIEVLLTEMAPPTESIQEYWEISLRLIDIVGRIEAYA